MGSDGIPVFWQEITNGVVECRVIHEREHSAPNAEEPYAVQGIPFENGQEVCGIPCAQLAYSLDGEAVHAQSAVSEQPVFGLARLCKRQVLTGIAKVTNHAHSIPTGTGVSRGGCRVSFI